MYVLCFGTNSKKSVRQNVETNPKNTDLLIFVLFDESEDNNQKNKNKIKTNHNEKKTHAKYIQDKRTTNLEMVKNAKCVHEQQKQIERKRTETIFKPTKNKKQNRD